MVPVDLPEVQPEERRPSEPLLGVREQAPLTKDTLGPPPEWYATTEVKAAPGEGVLDLGKERELRSLRTRVTELEGRLAVHAGKMIPGGREAFSGHDEKHSISCGQHPQVTVSMHTPLVTCTVCGERLEALDVLRMMVRREVSFCYWNNDLREKKKLLEKEVENLTRARNNLRAQVKRSNKKEK